MKTMLVAYASMSGNTEEVAELIQEATQAEGYQVTLYKMGSQEPIPTVADYDAFALGTYTWGKGVTPKRVKDFIAAVGYKPDNVYLFGTGDTQFGGDDLFCGAVDRLAKFYHSTHPVLKIEQSPRESQEQKVYDWVKGVIENETIRQSESINTREPESVHGYIRRKIQRYTELERRSTPALL